MNNFINVDTKILSDEIVKLDKISLQMEELFNNIKKNTDELKDFWETKTSNKTFLEFDAFYKICENIRNNNISDSKFLADVVKNSYEVFDSDTSNLIDSNISVKE